MHFGENLKQYREKAGLTQKDLSSRVYVSKAMIGAIEQEIRLPSLQLALALAHALGTDVETLAGVDTDM